MIGGESCTSSMRTSAGKKKQRLYDLIWPRLKAERYFCEAVEPVACDDTPQTGLHTKGWSPTTDRCWKSRLRP